jgi:predicted alpha/beta hydrolase
MGRGAQNQTLNLTDQQLAQTNALNQQLLGQQQSLGNQIASQYQNILNNPGYTAAQQAAITAQSQGALSSAFDALQQSALNRMARTGNSAGFSELTDDLARQKAEQEANLAQKNQVTFANTALQQQNNALQGLSGLFGVDTNLLGRTLGIPSQLLGVRANAARPTGFFTAMGSSLGSTLGTVPALFM